MNVKEVIEDLFYNEKYDLTSLLERLNNLLQCNVQTMDFITSDLIDLDLLNEIRDITACGKCVYFGKTLRDLKCEVQDEDGLRCHDILIKYIAPKKLIVSSANLPHSAVFDQEYRSLEEVMTSFKKYIEDLTNYFNELEHIDQFCTVMEPVNPTYKDNYRRILLDERTWLHVEITPDGSATNVHLVGQSEQWSDKLQTGLLSWEHDKDIVDNIMTVFDLVNFPVPALVSPDIPKEDKPAVEKPSCGICLCIELPDSPGVPQPLCQNPMCGVHYHRNCLFQWLVACAGSRPPAFGVATGTCPTCLKPIVCNEKDN